MRLSTVKSLGCSNQVRPGDALHLRHGRLLLDFNPKYPDPETIEEPEQPSTGDAGTGRGSSVYL